jgi:hypothetical protein
LLHVGGGCDIPEAEVAAELAGGVLCASMAILAGLIKTGAADGPASALPSPHCSSYGVVAPPPSRVGLAQLAVTSLFLVKHRHETATWSHRLSSPHSRQSPSLVG